MTLGSAAGAGKLTGDNSRARSDHGMSHQACASNHHLIRWPISMHTLTVTRTMSLSAATLYRAWTTGWASWFAEPDSLRMSATVGAPFFFEVGQRFTDGRPMIRHPHYGRFRQLVPGSLVELTWVTGPDGTAGAETVLSVRIDATTNGTLVTLVHSGFLTNAACERHAAAWPTVLEHQEARLRALDHDAVDLTPTDAMSRNRSMPDAALIPVRSYPDLEVAVTWLRETLHCRERLRVPGHRVQLTVGRSAMVAVTWDAGSSPATGGRPPATLMVRVPDVDVAYARALSSGGTGLTPPADMPYGERQATLRDPAGHAWTLTQTIADVDPATWGGELVD